MSNQSGKKIIKIYPDSAPFEDDITSEERKMIAEKLKEKDGLAQKIKELELKNKRNELIINQLSELNKQYAIRNQENTNELLATKLKLEKISKTREYVEKEKMPKKQEVTETESTAQDLRLCEVHKDGSWYGDIIKFKNWFLIGDGAVYQALRSAYKGKADVEEKIRVGKFSGSTIPMRSLYENLSNLQTTPNRVILAIGDVNMTRE